MGNFEDQLNYNLTNTDEIFTVDFLRSSRFWENHEILIEKEGKSKK
jgi:hypothetical protein